MTETSAGAPQKAMVIVAGGEAMGGAERRFLRTSQYLMRVDPSMHLIISRRLYELGDANHLIAPAAQRIHILPELEAFPIHKFRLLYWFLYNPLIVWIVIRQRIRVIHAILTGVYMISLALLLPQVRGVMSVVASGFTVYSRWTRPFYVFAMRRVKAIDTVAPSIKRDILASEVAFDGLADKTHISVCTFTDYSHFKPGEDKENWVVYASRFEPIKDPLLAVAVAQRVIQQHPDARVFLLGFGSMEAAVKQAVIDADIPTERIEVRFEPDVADILARAKIFLSLQVVENYSSQSILEAMACRCAVIATDVGDTALIVDDEVGARLPADADRIAAKVVDLLNDPVECVRLGQNAYTRVTTEHTLERFAGYLSEMYADVLAAP